MVSINFFHINTPKNTKEYIHLFPLFFPGYERLVPLTSSLLYAMTVFGVVRTVLYLHWAVHRALWLKPQIPFTDWLHRAHRADSNALGFGTRLFVAFTGMWNSLMSSLTPTGNLIFSYNFRLNLFRKLRIVGNFYDFLLGTSCMLNRMSCCIFVGQLGHQFENFVASLFGRGSLPEERSGSAVGGSFGAEPPNEVFRTLPNNQIW